ncbi:MAG: nickel-dependent lactate racemase, partial [Gemmatimonadetes bacterium]|nr:nickel-dependent lactate racemase [Gemmatimonadota bacterium]
DDDALAARLDAPIGSPPLDDLVRASDRVVVVVPDATRASGSDRVATALRRKLRALGLPDAHLEILIGGGTHRPPTPDEVRRIVGSEVLAALRIHPHDAFDERAHAHVGETPRGTPVELNRRLVQADRVILVGAIGFHYFAGFSGGRKALLPACASDRSIQANHLLGFDRERLWKAEGVATASLDGNPVSEDMEDAARLFGPTFLVNTVLDGRGRIVGAYAGDWHAAHRAGCADYLATHSVRAPERRPVVIVSAGGAPRDLNMIQSHKALEHARLLAEEGGDLVLLAECGDGLGRPDWLDWFAAGDAAEMAANLVRNYRIYGQTAWGVRWKTEVYRVRLVSALPPDHVRAMGMIPHASLEEAVAACEGDRGWILPQGLATLPRVGNASTATAPTGVPAA